MQNNTSLSDANCKNHPQIPSGYFLSDQPWVKYCNHCALNVALCGRKIEKELSPSEFDRKMQICSAVSEMKGSVEQVESTISLYKQLTELLEEVSAPLNAHLHQIQASVSQLLAAKEKIEQLYLQQISEKIHGYFERQSRISMLSTKMKKELEMIESNYSSLIEMSEEDFKSTKDKWNSIISCHKLQLITQDQLSQHKGKISKSVEEFYAQLETISKFGVEIKLTKLFEKMLPTDQFDITLTPLEGNSLNNSTTEVRGNTKGKAQLKLKTHKKGKNERQSTNTSKLNSRRQSQFGVENIYETQTKRLPN